MPLLRSFFIALSHNRSLRRFSERSRLGTRLSARFVAGLEIEDALRAAEAVNQQGMAVTLDSLGESVSSDAEARRSAEVYHCLLDAIAERKLNANISVKLTQMGLELSPGLAESIAEGLTEHAQATGNFLRIDMEDSSLTDATLAIVRRVHARPELSGAIGVVIQAYLYRSQADIEQLLAEGIRIRLCKGAYRESPAIALQSVHGIRVQYLALATQLLLHGVYPAIATHDPLLIEAVKRIVDGQAIEPTAFVAAPRPPSRVLHLPGCEITIAQPRAQEARQATACSSIQPDAGSRAASAASAA